MRKYFAKAHNQQVNEPIKRALYFKREGIMSPSFSSTRLLVTRSAAAAAMLMATYGAAPLPAHAEVAKPVDGLPTECLKAGNELAQLKCGRSVFQKQTAEAKARSADAKVRGTAADRKIAASQATKECMDSVTKDIQTASKAAPLKPEQVKAFESRIAGCERS